MGFFEFEKRWLRSIFDCVIPSGASRVLPEGAADVPLEGFIEDLLAHAPAQFCLGMRACTWAITLAPLLVLGRPKTFHGLSREDQYRVLDVMRSSDIYLVREMPLLFKTIGCLGYGGLPRIQARLDIEPRDATDPEWARRGAKS
ncbi:MAG: hypothetical protein KC766_12440 [Myxococcales bacterium]|nr:hypothetical protein [Myxococcales bacterium]